MTSTLVTIAPVAQLSTRVWRVLGGNPGTFTLQGTNTYIVGSGPRRLLIDTGEGKEAWREALRTLSHQEKFTISQVVCTHHHHDHCGGCAHVRELFDSGVTFFKVPDAEHDTFPFTALHLNNREGAVSIKTDDGSATLHIIATPGHTDDHICLFLEEEQIMFTGDCILGQGTAVFQNLRLYMSSLAKLLPYKPILLFPGHGPVVEHGVAKIQEYIDHRTAREQQIVQFLQSCVGPTTVSAIVADIYRAYPSHLHKPAEGSVLLHLQKLLEEGLAVHNDVGQTWALKHVRSNQ